MYPPVDGQQGVGRLGTGRGRAGALCGLGTGRFAGMGARGLAPGGTACLWLCCLLGGHMHDAAGGALPGMHIHLGATWPGCVCAATTRLPAPAACLPSAALTDVCVRPWGGTDPTAVSCSARCTAPSPTTVHGCSSLCASHIGAYPCVCRLQTSLYTIYCRMCAPLLSTPQVAVQLEVTSRGSALPAKDEDDLLMQSELLDGVILQLASLRQAFSYVSAGRPRPARRGPGLSRRFLPARRGGPAARLPCFGFHGPCN